MARVRTAPDKVAPLSSSIEAAGLAALLSLDRLVHQPSEPARAAADASSELRSAPAPENAGSDLASTAGASHPEATGNTAAVSSRPVEPPAVLQSTVPETRSAVAPASVEVVGQPSVLEAVDSAPLGCIGPHWLREAINHDGLGRLFKAWDSKASADVAVTVLDLEPDAKGRDGILEKLQQGVMAAAGLAHPGLVRIHDAGVIGEGVYVATEWLPGRSMASALRSGWQPTAKVAAQVVARLSEALSHVHAHGIVHGGLNPATVVLDADDHPKITGLGYACAAYASDLPSMDPLVTGAAPYLAPEQFQGGAVDARTDIHALGVVLYELLTGRRAYPGDTVPAIAHALLHHDPAPPHWLRLDLPERLSAIAMQALQRNPAARYASAADVTAALKLWLQEVESESRVEHKMSGAVQLDQPQNPRKKRWVGVGMVVAAAAALAFSWAKRGEPPPATSTPSPSAQAPVPLAADQSVEAAPALAETTTLLAPSMAQTTASPDDAAPTTEPRGADGAIALSAQDEVQPEPPLPTAPTGGGMLSAGQGPSSPAANAVLAKPAAGGHVPVAVPPKRRRAQVVAARPVATRAAPEAAAPMGTVHLAITPWGYVEVEGRPAGATPPLNALSLPAGRHTVTIRNQDFPPFVTTVQVSADKVATVRHRFAR